MIVLLATLLANSSGALPAEHVTVPYQVVATCAISSTTDQDFVGSVNRGSGGSRNSRPQFYQIRNYQTESPAIRLYRKDWLDEWPTTYLVPAKFDKIIGFAAFDILEEGEMGGIYVGKIAVWALDSKIPSLVENKVRLWREDAWTDLSSDYFHSSDAQKANVEKMNPGKAVIVTYAAADCTKDAMQNAISHWQKLSGESDPVGTKK
jgi:hypothetical protein